MATLASKPITEQLRNYPQGIVAIPVIDWMWTESAQAIMRLLFNLPPGSDWGFVVGPSTIAPKRNECVRWVLEESEFEWLLFIDSDMTPPPNLALRLLEHHVDIVSALYFARRPPHMTCAGFERSGSLDMDFAADGGLEKVDYVGAGALLIQRHVLQTVYPPWFGEPTPGVDDDLYFCQKARAAGFDIHVDTSLCVGHMTTHPVDKSFVESYVRSPNAKGFRTTAREHGIERRIDVQRHLQWLERARCVRGSD